MAEGDATPSDVPDVLAPDLRIVFVGINPGRVSAEARALREPAQRLLAPAPRGSADLPPLRAVGAVHAAHRGDRRHERRVSHDAGLERPSAARLRAALPTARGIARELQPRGSPSSARRRTAARSAPAAARPQEDSLVATRSSSSSLHSARKRRGAVDERLRWFRSLPARESAAPDARRASARVRRRDARCCSSATATVRQLVVTPGGGRGRARRRAASARAPRGDRPRRVRSRPLLWELSGWTREEPGFGSFLSRIYLVRVDRFELPHLTEAHEARWFSPSDLKTVSTRPPDLAERLSSASGS
jgi:hypothetical protein